jgi:hypothetical protein
MDTKTGFQIRFDTMIMLILATVSLEINVPFVLDQLNFHQTMPQMGFWQRILCPGGSENPLVILNNYFGPLRLMIRTITLLIVMIWFVLDIAEKGSRLKDMLVIMLIILHVFIPTTLMIQSRLSVDNHALAHDGGTIQIEESMKMVLAGKNPYSETFHGTPLENWRGFTNHIIYHVPYMPGSFIYSIPVFYVIHSLSGYYDQRIFHLGLFVLSLILISRLINNGSKRRIAWLVFALNPFFTRYFALGTNDIVIMFLLLLAMTCIHKQHHTTGLLALAAACSVKQFAWFFVPFLAVIALQLNPWKPQQWTANLKIHGKRWLPGLVLFLLTVLPFVFINPAAFYNDTVRYGAGGLPTSYPMQGFHGYGFATILLFLQWVPDGSAQFPFVILQTMFTLPLFVWLWYKYGQHKTLQTGVLFSAVTLLPFMYFSRYLHGNFVGFIIFWPILAWCMNPEKDGA